MKKTNSEILQMFGAHYFDHAEDFVMQSGEDDLYEYSVYGETQKLEVPSIASAFAITSDGFVRVSGPTNLHNVKFATLIWGFKPPMAIRSSDRLDTNLPYVNGCSTEQIFPPIRAGDPTMQLLYIPPYTAEQAHHIHSTVRVVYVLSGKGWSVVGTSEKTEMTALIPGRICILEKMCPHHFETDEDGLTVIPIHVWSSIGGGEYNHPMMNGTYLTEK